MCGHYVYNLLNFDKYMHLYNKYPDQDVEHFGHLTKFPPTSF